MPELIDPDSAHDLVAAVRAAPFAVMVTDATLADNPVVFANDAFYQLTGYAPAEVLGRNSRFLQGRDTDPAAVADIAAAVRDGRPIQRELLNYRKDGRPFWNEMSIRPRRDSAGRVVGFVALHLDVTERREAREARSELEVTLTGIVGNLPGYIFQRLVRPDGSLAFGFLSASFWRILGFPERLTTSYDDFLACVDPRDREPFRKAVARSIDEAAPVTIEFRVIPADGQERWFRSRSTPRTVAGDAVVWDGVGIEITAERASKDALAYMAFHDTHTGLANRLRFNRALEEAVLVAGPDQPGIVAFAIDLDEFQEINDTLGSAIGDAVLRSVAERLRRFAGSKGIAARLGGDEFGVFWRETPTEASLLDVAAGLCRELSRPVIIEGHEIVAQACVGATAYCLRDDVTAPGDPAPGPTAPMAATPSSLADEIVKQSNLALAEAKRAGRGAHRIYAAELDDRERSRVILRQSLQRAVGEEQFLLHYHPLVDLRSGRIVGAEALVRWEHPELGMQQPDRFIPLAEASGLIVPLGRWVLRTALRELSEWARAGIDPPRVSVNISSVQLRDPDFIAAIDEALADTGCDPRRIDFELTESVLIEASSRTLTVLNALKRRGFRLALDDFGTGYSSFQYLRSLPIDKVKIDQAFVRRMAVDSSDAAIVRAIMTVARSLSLEIVAEGIETLVQRDFLRNEGCPVGQGYFFSLPLPAPAFRELLGRRVMLPVWERSA